MVRLPVELNAFTLKGAGLPEAFPVPKSQGLVGTTRFCASTTAQDSKLMHVLILDGKDSFMVKKMIISRLNNRKNVLALKFTDGSKGVCASFY
jgi:hypothetical protein